jgi:hypothetical protein
MAILPPGLNCARRGVFFLSGRDIYIMQEDPFI